MRRNFWKWSIPAVCLAAAAAISGAALSRSAAPTVQPTESVGMAQTEYLLRLEGMTLRVYRNGEDMPLMEHEILPSLLPEEDRQRLEEGITVTDLSELRQRVEDFLS